MHALIHQKLHELLRDNAQEAIADARRPVYLLARVYARLKMNLERIQDFQSLRLIQLEDAQATHVFTIREKAYYAVRDDHANPAVAARKICTLSVELAALFNIKPPA